VTQQKKPGETFLPNFCSVRMVFIMVIVAELLAIVLSLSSSNAAAGYSYELSLHSLFVQWNVLLGVALLCLLRTRLAGLSHGVAGLLVWMLFVIITFLTGELALFLLQDTEWQSSHLYFQIRNLSISAIITAVALRYLYLQYLWRQQEVAESQARFQALQSRIRPHFLFNSMNTIASLTRTKPELAEEVVHDLSDLFRANLSDAQNLSTLGKELELAQGYIRIEQQRLGERLRVVWDLEELPQEARMPALILQPLLENAVYHGIEPAAEPGTIHITGRYRRLKINLSIRNTLPNDGSSSHRESNRLAVDNIRQRLQAIFDEDAGLTASEVDGDHQVRLYFPHPWIEL
jgi:two-component system sensor histidine kinase AlgZ